MKKLCRVFLVMAMILLVLCYNVWAEERFGGFARIKDAIREDYKFFYSRENLWNLTIGIGMAGVVANTPIDEEIRDWYQESLRSKSTDSFSEKVKPFGDGRLTVPIYLGAVIFGELTDHTRLGSTIAEWGELSLRALLVGAPPMLFLQAALGAGRPEEGGSCWQPFKDNNAVSGHGFMGAIPFITAAKMTNSPYLKYSLYLASTLCALSRINDDAHYFSQAALGWWIAYLAVTSVKKTETERQKVVIAPAFIPDGVGATVALRF